MNQYFKINLKENSQKNKEWGCWILNKEKGNTVQVPKGTAKALFNAGLMIDCKIPLDKRDMNWGDNPILI